MRAIQTWPERTYQVPWPVSGPPNRLHRLGFAYKLPPPVPCGARAAARAALLGQLAGLAAETAAGQAGLCCADAARPTHNTRCTRAGGARGPERPLPTVSGRGRGNLNAALNAHCPARAPLDETDRADAQSTRRRYEPLPAAHPDTPTICVVCDNARYYKNKDSTAWLADKRIQQVFLPPCSPNLNLIERLWKYLRQKSINATDYQRDLLPP